MSTGGVNFGNAGAAGGSGSLNFGGTNIDLGGLLSALQGGGIGGAVGSGGLIPSRANVMAMMSPQFGGAPTARGGGGGAGNPYLQMGAGMMPGSPYVAPGFTGGINGMPNATAYGDAVGGMPYGTGGAQIQDWNQGGGGGGSKDPYLDAKNPQLPPGMQPFDSTGAPGGIAPIIPGAGQGTGEFAPTSPINPYDWANQNAELDRFLAPADNGTYGVNYGAQGLSPNNYYNPPTMTGQAYGQPTVLPPAGSSLAGSDWSNGGYSADQNWAGYEPYGGQYGGGYGASDFAVGDGGGY